MGTRLRVGPHICIHSTELELVQVPIRRPDKERLVYGWVPCDRAYHVPGLVYSNPRPTYSSLPYLGWYVRMRMKDGDGSCILQEYHCHRRWRNISHPPKIVLHGFGRHAIVNVPLLLDKYTCSSEDCMKVVLD